MRNKATYAKLISEEAKRRYAALPPPGKREVQERYRLRKEMDRARAKRRIERQERDEFGLEQIIEHPQDQEEGEDFNHVWAEEPPPEGEGEVQQRWQPKRVAASDEELGDEEQEEEEDPFADNAPAQDNDADFLATHVASMNNMDYAAVNEDDKDDPEPLVIDNEPPLTATPPPPPPPPQRPAPTPPRRATRAGSKAAPRMPPPAKPAPRAAAPKAGPSRVDPPRAPAQPEAGPSRLPTRLPTQPPRAAASRRDSMTEVERALQSDSEDGTPKGKAKRRKGSVSSDDADARLLLQHNALLTGAPSAAKKQRTVPEQTFSPRKLRARPGPGSVASARPAPRAAVKRERRAASVKTAPVLVPIVQAGSTTSGDDGAFKPPRNTRARAVREAQTPFTPLPNTRAAQVTSSRGTGG
ncbi:hypothetical protein AURDEDRAFT_115522 [Auricularia subglabra TFB-10046 SS5]|nr:hypothetical protein AURDEDRAFT_115522 [Auricularia subglabra TFB-10046 SS5]